MVMVVVVGMLAGCRPSDDDKCRGGDVRACRRLAQAVGARDPAAAIAALDRVCRFDRKDRSEACLALATILMRTPPPVGDRARAESLYRQSCAAHLRVGCAMHRVLCEREPVDGCATPLPAPLLEAPVP